MSQLKSRIVESLYERARYWVQARQIDTLIRRLGIGRYQGCTVDQLETLASIRTMVEEPVTVLVDVGAHRGKFAGPAAKVLGVNRVICYEPVHFLHRELDAMLAGIEHEIRSFALSDMTGPAPFYIHQDMSMSSLLGSDKAVLAKHFDTYSHEKIEEAMVETTTLDLNLLADLQPEDRVFLKLDTQGSELQVLRGSRSCLKHCAAVMVEYMFSTPYKNQERFEDLVQYMDGAGFNCKGVVDLKRRSSMSVSGVDFLFLPCR